MSIVVSAGLRGGVFAVPNQVADRHLKFCSALHLKVLLLALRHSDQPLDPSAIASLLRQDPKDVADAVAYWLEAGIFCQDDQPQPLREGEAAGCPAPQPPADPLPAAGPLPCTETHRAPSGQRVTTLRQRPRLTTGEINRLAEKDKAIPSLLQGAQEILGKELTPAESDTLVYLYTYCRLSPEYICLLLHHCVSIGKGNLRYVEKTAAGWMDKGIDTAEKAAGHIDLLARQNAAYQLVQGAFGIHGRDLTTREKEFADRWTGEYAMGIDLIRLAYERAVDATGKLNFSYINKILTDWHAKGVRTPAQALEEIQQGAAARKAQAQEASPSYDLDAIKWVMTNGPVGHD